MPPEPARRIRASVEVDPAAMGESAAAYREVVGKLRDAKAKTVAQFLALGHLLKRVRDERLFAAGGHRSFNGFLGDPAVDIAPAQAEIYVALAEEQDARRYMALGPNKVNELMRLPEPRRREILSSPVATDDGSLRTVDELSSKDVRRLARDIRREGKTKCDRCLRWVDEIKEIDGKFYGSSGAHSCYDMEMEDRRRVEAHPIPAPQLDNVLNVLKEAAPPPEPAAEAPALPDTPLAHILHGFLTVYTQVLYEGAGEAEAPPPPPEAEAEAELIQRAVTVLRNRLARLKKSE